MMHGEIFAVLAEGIVWQQEHTFQFGHPDQSCPSLSRARHSSRHEATSFRHACKGTSFEMRARTDMLTIQAAGWNRRKNNMHRVLSIRYLKTTAKIQEETQTLEKFKSDLGVGDETLYNWTMEVQQWANTEETNENMDGPQVVQRTIEVLFLSIKQRKRNLYRQTDGCKKRHLLHRKILEEKAKLTAVTEEYNTLVPDSAIPSTDEILSADLHAWPWELHGQIDLLTKKIAFDRVMLLRWLKEEELTVLKEVKQHWESLKRESENVQDLASHVTLDLSRQI
ncbi:uncharacterized protein [Salvelinus alpinus]|uniref:uncharacterized protein isoform X1 n=1 Tax=Salvelinus alpinus TaxID=8036 RepID=UPI0039FCFB29